MDYKRLYEQSLERARVWKDRSGMPADKQGILDDIFPELAESEDEKIRKSLIILLQHFCKGYRVPGLEFPVSYKDMLAWLEKQGEFYTKRDVDNAYIEGMAFAKDELEKQGKQKSQRMISAEAKEAMYDKPANTVELKCEESKTKVFDAPTPFEDKLYAFVAACEFLAIPSKIEFILEHSQEILDAAREQIGKEETAWSEDDDAWMDDIISKVENNLQLNKVEIDWLKSLKDRYTWKPSDAQMDSITCAVRKMKESACYDSELVLLLNELKKLKGE